VPVVAGVLILITVGAWTLVRSSRERWARYVALPEIHRLAEQENFIAAYELAERTRRYLPGDRELERLLKSVSSTTSIRTDPPGASVSWKKYDEPDSTWHALGRTPLDSPLRPRGYFRWRFEKPGFDTVERAVSSSAINALTATLHPAGTRPSGMIWVPSSEVQIAGKPVPLDGFWLDQLEVSNRQFKAFVDAGGYRKRELWKYPFVKDGREVSWEDAVRDLVDKTGRPGPATWELGSYPAGQDDLPVQGVSWYEAAAYAEFAGKSLPTVHHWLRATDSFSPPELLALSNFDGKGPTRVGERRALGLFGTYDMAGNVKEWCWNASGQNRYTAGGAWGEPTYLYRSPHAQSPFDRAETQGFRCAKYDRPSAESLLAPLEKVWRDYAHEAPVDDATFRLYAGLYAYDRSPLDPTTEAVDGGSPLWKVEKVTFNAAYGGERVIGHIFLPANAAPPFQTVIYFPGSGSMSQSRFEAYDRQNLEFVVRSGRAVFFPIYKGTYERRLRALPADGSRAERDLIIQWQQDVARSIDYLETRPDVAAGKLAYVGFSLGAEFGITFLALEKRLKAAVLVSGGLDEYMFFPEVDPLNFVTRVTIPTLMVNGRDDFRFPLEASQKPMFRLLGTPAEHKQHLVVPGGHVPARLEVIKATLGWLDRYLGPVATKG
jgi:dienelactone hydrolase